MSEIVEKLSIDVFSDIRSIINDSKAAVAQSVNSTVTAMYWHIGNRIKVEILNNKRAEYGKEIVGTLARQLAVEFGKGWSRKQLFHCLRFSEAFPDLAIVSTLWRQLSWSHFKLVMYLENAIQRDFYLQISRVERWSVRTLQIQMDSMLFERTAISKKPDELAETELKLLAEKNILSPDLVFKDHYILDFLDLKDTYLEYDLETAILNDIEHFILELGGGFTFVARQKRMTIDNTDFSLDLLFYHRKLKRLVAVELKLGKFKAAYKGQMELYLRWLEKYEKEIDEESPVGLILCAEGNQEQVELLQLDQSNIRVAEYITQQIDPELLKERLHRFRLKAEALMELKNMERAELNGGNDE